MPIRWLILLDFSRSCQNLVSFWLKQLACCCCNTSPLAAMQDECATANAAILKRLGGNTGQVQTRLRVHDVHELANEKSRKMRILMKLKLLKLKSNAMGLKIAKDKAARKKLATSRSLMRAKFGKGMPLEELEEGMAEQAAEEAEFQRVYELFDAEHRDYFFMEHSSSSERSSSSSEGSRVSPESRAALAKSCKDAFAYIFNKY